MQPFQIFVMVQPYLKQFGAIQTENIDSGLATKMQRNGQVRIKRREAGRVLVYAAAIRESAVNHSMVGDLASRLFHGDVTQMVQHLLESDDVGPEELARLERLIQERKRR